MGETRVDLLHLLEDLRDAYPGPSEETILADVVANSLDSEARTITLATDPAARTLTIVDDGRGMRRRELARYHDVAASTKIRGDTIGFAGIGIKIALLVSAQVVTETRAATTWPPPGAWPPVTAHPGSGRRRLASSPSAAPRSALTLDNGLSPLLDPGYVETVLRSHFEPLLTPSLAGSWPRAIRRGSAWSSMAERARPSCPRPATRRPSACDSAASARRPRSAGWSGCPGHSPRIAWGLR